MVLRSSNKTQQIVLETRQLQLYIQVINKLGTPEFLNHYIKVMYNQKYEDYDECTRAEVGSNALLFESVK
jgi:hypothetical protein